MKHKIHPLAELFPMMEDAEIADLAADIKANGMRASITLFEEKILDGRNRLLACEIAGVEPKFREHKGGDALAFVLSANLHRRHLTSSQRAMVASRLENMPSHRPENKDANLHTSRSQAAEALNVSPRSVASASKIADESPNLAKQVVNGSISLNKAVEKLKEEKASVIQKGQNKPVVKDTKNRAVPEPLISIWNRRGEVNELLAMISNARSKIRTAQDTDDPLFMGFNFSSALSHLNQTYTAVKGAVPFTVCTTCQGLRPKACGFCKGKGFISEIYWQDCVPVEVKELIEKVSKQ